MASSAYQVILSSEEGSKILARNHKGTILKTYQCNGNHASRTLCLLDREYIMSAQADKPFIHAWTVHGNGQIHMKMVIPGRASALCVTPNSVYCMGGVNKQLLLWDVPSGNLIAVLGGHFQNITCIRCTDDGSRFISAAEDNLVHVWSLAKLLSTDVTIVDGRVSNVTPVHTWSDHSAPVTDVHVGYGSICARVATCSLDQTCKLYELLSGQMLLNIHFPDALSAVTLDIAEYHMIVGGLKGKMYLVKLYAPPRTLEHHFSSEEKPHVFEGHSKRVTSLAVSSDGFRLLSGSSDTTVKMWNISTAQCINTFNHGGPVTNVAFANAYSSFFTTEAPRPRIVLGKFKQSLYWDPNVDRSEQKLWDIPTWIHGQDDEPTLSSYEESARKRSRYLKPVSESSDWEVVAKNLLQTNKQIYDYAVQHVLQKKS